MEDWQKRLIEEQKDLAEKISRLRAFLVSCNPADVYQYELLSIQLQAMRTYHECLLARINALKQWDKKL